MTLCCHKKGKYQITDTVLTGLAQFKDMNLVKEKDQEMLWKVSHNYKGNERIIKYGTCICTKTMMVVVVAFIH